MFDAMIDQSLNEVFSNATYMDVRELRSLYYGRLNMYVSFTDNSKYITKNKDQPDGIIAHQVDTVVGRKANTNLFYGRVFRIDKSAGKFVEDIKTHSNDSLQTDLDAIRALSFLKDSAVEDAINSVMTNSRFRTAFSRLWEITKRISKGDGALWSKILTSIGYIGFADQTGTGILSKKKHPVAILLDTGAKQDFDIVPLQKYRTDPRARIRDDVNHAVKKMSTARNRVAKKETEVFRTGKSKKGALDDFKELIKIIGGM